MKPLVSFCLPAYNAAPYLAEAIESCLAQDYSNIEIVVVNDGSTDSSDVLMQHYKDNPKIKYVKQENKGIAAARNAAVATSSGEYIAVMDSDDICSPLRIEKSIKKLLKTGADVVYSSYYAADEEANVSHGQDCCPEVTKENIIENTSAPHVTIVAKRKCFVENPYPEHAKVNDDAWLLALWYKAGYKFVPIHDPLMIVRFHNVSTSATRDKEIRKIGKEVEKFLG